MMRLHAYLPAARVPEVVAALAAVEGVHHTVRSGAGGTAELVTAEVEPRSGDLVFDILGRLGVPPADVSLQYETSARPIGSTIEGWVGAQEVMVWADVVQTAGDNARVFARYLAYMLIAGVIAGFGVMNKSSILIVGAMAVSPDLLPMSAVGVGLVDRRWRLAGRALGTLALGLVATGLAAAAVTAAMRAIGYAALQTDLGDGGLGVLPTVNASTFIIAFVAGIAGMLALQTRASAAVGVAISITTVPAASYAGVALVVDHALLALIAIAVLAINVAMILAAGTLTLAIQRRIRTGRRPRA